MLTPLLDTRVSEALLKDMQTDAGDDSGPCPCDRQIKQKSVILQLGPSAHRPLDPRTPELFDPRTLGPSTIGSLNPRFLVPFESWTLSLRLSDPRTLEDLGLRMA